MDDSALPPPTASYEGPPTLIRPPHVLPSDTLIRTPSLVIDAALAFLIALFTTPRGGNGAPCDCRSPGEATAARLPTRAHRIASGVLLPRSSSSLAFPCPPRPQPRPPKTTGMSPKQGHTTANLPQGGP